MSKETCAGVKAYCENWRDELLEISKKTPYESYLIDELNDRISALEARK